MTESKIIASRHFEGLDELITALEALRDLDGDNYPGVEGTFVLQGYCVLWDHGDDIHAVEITDKFTDEIKAKNLND